MSSKIAMISLGCSKNTVDSETMLAMLKTAGFELTISPEDADVVVINTCGFIEAAKKEAIEQILGAIELKTQGKISGIVVCGCLSQRYRDTIADEFPEVDAFLGTTSENDIVAAALCALEHRTYACFDRQEDKLLFGERILSTPSHTAYLKISEGCDNRCTYCAIPLIRGPLRSVPIEALVLQAKALAKSGVRELCVIAQDITVYGMDLYKKRSLVPLLHKLCEIEELKWIRLLYCYPDKIDDELLHFMNQNDKILKYLDIPIQHADKRILRAMNRPGDYEGLLALITKIRKAVPGIALRTTLIAGFPGEDDAAYETLCRFVKDAKFERLGVFAYSQEEDTPAAELPNQLSEEIKQARCDTLLTIQNAISTQFLNSIVGAVLTVLIEEYDEEGVCYIGRSYLDAPDIDGRIYFSKTEDCEIGDFVEVKVTGSLEYDLIGEMIL